MLASTVIRLCLLATLTPGCLFLPVRSVPVVVVTRRGPPPRPIATGPRCPGGSYVEGYHDAWGRYHYPHWQCPSGTVIIERR